MDTPNNRYEIIIAKHLSQDWVEELFPGFQVCFGFNEHQEPVTKLMGSIIDQSDLFGLLLRLSNLNIQLVSIKQISNKEEDNG